MHKHMQQWRKAYTTVLCLSMHVKYIRTLDAVHTLVARAVGVGVLAMLSTRLPVGLSAWNVTCHSTTSVATAAIALVATAAVSLVAAAAVALVVA